ncbi:hypothetical protein TRFO_17043 [Tritrichomonas foetus]|uniref:Uncharacterized protein n=1 Tax=Tritrichomonas foetus TaxID=1144522 RepID=A0A1J4KNU1_9EUKA|nr:hypothetical protein TRFO_17043 [Tritrichomonas foetus]|eukprot:OHT12899.1 hypothetical protein TRFO_17043 [Tritrichomonas foetus]
MEEKKQRDDRYFPNQEELKILQKNIVIYFNYPKRSQDRKNFNTQTTKELNEINPGHWNDTSVRVWFTNNQKLVDPNAGQAPKAQINLNALPPNMNPQLQSQSPHQQSPSYDNQQSPAYTPTLPLNINTPIQSQAPIPPSSSYDIQQSPSYIPPQPNSPSILPSFNSSIIQPIFKPTTPPNQITNSSSGLASQIISPTSSMPPLTQNISSLQPIPQPQIVSEQSENQQTSLVSNSSDKAETSYYPSREPSTSGFADFFLNREYSMSSAFSGFSGFPSRTNSINDWLPAREESTTLNSSQSTSTNKSTQNEGNISFSTEIPPLRQHPTVSFKQEKPPQNFMVKNEEEESNNESADEDDESDDLPSLPNLEDWEPNTNSLDTMKYDLYNRYLQNCYHYIRKLKEYSPEERLPRQEKAEERFVQFLNIFTEKLGIDKIYSKDQSAPNVSLKMSKEMRRQVSRTTQEYNNEPFVPENTSDEVELISESESIFYPKKFMIPAKLSPNLKSFYYGKYQPENRTLFDIHNIEASIIHEGVAINVVYKDEFKSHQIVQGQNDVEQQSGFFLPATSMTVSDKILWIQGDVRVRAFDLETLECTDTLYVRKEFVKKSSITIWGNNVALGLDDTVYIWPRVSATTSSQQTKSNAKFKQKYEDMARRTGIEVRNVDWTHGRVSKKKLVSETMKDISSICAVNDSLVVASSDYPVIHVFNQDGSIVARLVGHTMGITCLKPFGDNKFFSGSKDMTVKLWSLQTGVAEMCFLRHGDEISSLMTAEYETHKFLFSGGKDSRIHVWDMTNKRGIFEIAIDKNRYPTEMYFSPNEATLIFIDVETKPFINSFDESLNTTDQIAIYNFTQVEA